MFLVSPPNKACFVFPSTLSFHFALKSSILVAIQAWVASPLLLSCDPIVCSITLAVAFADIGTLAYHASVKGKAVRNSCRGEEELHTLYQAKISPMGNNIVLDRGFGLSNTLLAAAAAAALEAR
jgi:hypothetical protein